MVSLAAFSIRDMYRMAQRSDQVWGIGGYEVPKQNFDHQQHAKEIENMLVMSGKKKSNRGGPVDSKAQRGGMFKDIENRSKSLPSPWNYDIRSIFDHNLKDHPPSFVPPERLQRVKFQWQSLPKEQQVVFRQVKRRPEKIDKTTKKHTFIEQIIQQNTKENYPKPGPGNYFLTQTAIKKYYNDHADLMARKNEEDNEQKASLPYNKKQGKATLLLLGP